MSKKRFLSSLLAVIMIVTMLPISGLAAAVEPTTGSDLTTHQVVTNGSDVQNGTESTGVVKGSKTAQTTADVNEFVVTLTAKGSEVKTAVPGADIVLVLDRSNSMDGYFGDMKTAAKKLINTLLADSTSQNRISIVVYGTSADAATPFYGYQNKSTLINTIPTNCYDNNNQSRKGGTNTQAAMYAARTQLGKSTAADKFIVIMSDGVPTYSVYASNDKYNTNVFSGETASLSKGDYAKLTYYYNSGYLSGNGTDIGNGNTFTQEGYIKGYYNTYWDDIRFTCPNAAIYEAGLAKAADYPIYSIGFNVSANSSAENTLKAMASSKTSDATYYYNAPDGKTLEEAFGKIGQSILDSTSASGVTDPIKTSGDGSTQLQVDLVGGSLQKASSAALKDGNYYTQSAKDVVSYKNGVLNWSPADITAKTDTTIIGSTLYYKVKVDVESAAYNPANAIPTNGVTTLGYTDIKGDAQTLTYTVPTVKAVYGTVQVVGVRTDKDGSYLNATGKVVTDPADAEIVVQSSYVNNANGKKYFDPDHKAIAAAAPAAPAGFEAKDSETSKSVDLTYDKDDAGSYNKIVYFGYYELPTTGTISVHKKGYKDNGATENLRGAEFGVYRTEADAAAGTNPVTTIKSTGNNATYKSEQLAAGSYYVRETKAPENYLLSDTIYTVTVSAGNTSELNYGGHVIGDLVNIKSIDVPVSKVWEDSANLYGLRPGSVELTLTGTTSDSAAEKIVRTEQVTGTGDTWSHTFTGLPKTDGKGNAYTYKITAESALASYNYAISKDGKTITNTLKATDFSFVKTDDDGQALTGVTFKLQKGETVVATAQTDANGKVTFTGIAAGSYTLTESVTPAGYTPAQDKAVVVSDKLAVTIGGAAVTGSTAVENTAKTNTITLEKKGSDGTSYTAADVNFSVKDDLGNRIAMNGLTFTAKYGRTYTVTETKAPTGYDKLDKSFTVAFTDADCDAVSVGYQGNVGKVEVKNGNKLTVVVTDRQQLGSIEITKTGANGVKLAGVSYEIYNADPQVNENAAAVYTIITNDQGVAAQTEVPYGHYWAKEIDAPAEYNLNTAVIDLGQMNSSGLKLTKGQTDTLVSGAITLTKKDAETKVVLNGAEFDIYLGDPANGGEKVDHVVLTNGSATTKALGYGNYYAKETKAPAGYDLEQETVVSLGLLDRSHTTFGVDVFNGNKTVRTITLTKTDGAAALAGAGFTVTDGTKTVALTADENGSSWTFAATAGVVYTVTESKVPGGYNGVAGSFTVKLNDDGEGVTLNKDNVTTDKNAVAANGTTVTVTNEKILGSIEIAKTGDRGAALAGVTYTIYAENPDTDGDGVLSDAEQLSAANTVYTTTEATGKDGKATVSNVPVGSYWAVEAFAPAEYELSREVLALGKIAATGDKLTASQTDKLVTGFITVTKTDADTKAEIKGATFALYKVEGVTGNWFVDGWKTLVNWVTGETATGAVKVGEKTAENSTSVTFEGLGMGSYFAVETGAPEGYELNTEPTDYVTIVRGGSSEMNLSIANSKKTADITIQKVDAAGSALEGAAFTVNGAALAANEADASTYTFKATWGVEYVIAETGAPDKFVGLDKSFTVKLDANGKAVLVGEAVDGVLVRNDGVTVQVENTKEQVTITAAKVWRDDIAAGSHPAVKVQLLRSTDGENYETVGGKQSLADGAALSWTEDRYDDAGAEYTYLVEESDIPNEYVSAVTAAENTFNFTITNTATADVIVKPVKVWKDAGSKDFRPAQVTFTVTRAVGGATEAGFNEQIIVTGTKADNTWNTEGVTLPKYDANGRQYTYTITENEVDYYTSQISDTVLSENVFSATATNTLQRTGSITATKSWQDTNGKGRPTSLTLTLHRYSENVAAEIVTAAAAVTGIDTAEWTYTWANMPLFDAQGDAYAYYVTEDTVPAGYVLAQEDVNNTDLAITNTRFGETTVTVEKIWANDDNKAQSDVTFTLTRKAAGESAAAAFENNTLTLTKDKTTVTSGSLPQYNEAGKLYTYYVTEEVPTGYRVSYDTDDGQVVNGTVTATNTRTDDSGVVEVSKVWKDDVTDHSGYQVTVTLYRKIAGGQAEIAMIDGEPASKTIIGNGTVRFENLARYDVNGKAYSYDVEESNMRKGDIDVSSLYTSTKVSGTTADANTILITNTLKGENEPVIAAKQWQDNVNAYSTRPESLTMTLHSYTMVDGVKGNDQIVGSPLADHTVAQTNANQWLYNFGTLPTVDSEGRTLYYYVTEGEITLPADADYHYEPVTEGATSLVLINRLVGTTEVVISKKWEDNNNAEGVRPATVELTLGVVVNGEVRTIDKDADGNELKTTVTVGKTGEGAEAVESWSHTFANLPKYDASGAEYQYVAAEVGNPNYYEKSEGQTTSVVNTLKANHSITVRYIDADTGAVLLGDALYKNPKTASGRWFEADAYDAAAASLTNPNIAGYTKLDDNTGAAVSGSMGTEDLLIKVRYSKVKTIPVTVQYREVAAAEPGSYDFAAAAPITGIDDKTTMYAPGEMYNANRDPSLTVAFEYVKSVNAMTAADVADGAATGIIDETVTSDGLAFVHYFVRRAEPVSQILHSYAHTHTPLTGAAVTTPEGQTGGALAVSGTVNVADLLVTNHNNGTADFAYNAQSAVVTRRKAPQTADELKAAVNAKIEQAIAAVEAVAAAQGELTAAEADLTLKQTEAQAAQKAYADAQKALADKVAADAAVIAAELDLAGKQADVTAANAAVAEQTAQIAELEGQILAKQAEIDALDSTQTDYADQKAKLMGEKDALNAQKTLLEDQLLQAQGALLTATYDEAKAQAALDAAKAAVDTTAEQAALDAAFAAQGVALTAQNEAALRKKNAVAAYESAYAAEQANYAPATALYQQIVADCTEPTPTEETVYTGAVNGSFTVESGYSYTVTLSYLRATKEEATPTPTPTPATPTPTPVPVVPTPAPTTVPILDEDVPLGALPSSKPKATKKPKKGTYTIDDEDVPLGALPNTAGSRGGVAGGLGALMLLAGSVLHLFKKKDDED